MPKTEWKSICAACAEGTAPGRCAYYGDPNGCNAPTLGQHPEGDLAEQLQEELEKAERRIAELERAAADLANLRSAVEKIRDSFKQNEIAYWDRWRKWSDWHWDKKAKKAKEMSDMFAKYRQRIDAALKGEGGAE